MIDRYKNIFGFFDYSKLYSMMVDKFPDGSAFVELGVYFGKSLCYLAEECIKKNKKIKLYGIDHWKDLIHEFDENPDIVPKEIFDANKTWQDVYDAAIKNLKRFDNVTLIKEHSQLAASLFNDSSIDFVFVDAGHDYESVTNDLIVWMPKLKPSGIIAGHDYTNSFPSVKAAVKNFFPFKKIKVIGKCWLYNMGN